MLYVGVSTIHVPTIIEVYVYLVAKMCTLYIYLVVDKDVMQGKLFQRCTHFLYCSVMSLGGNVNTRRMPNPDMGSIFHIINQGTVFNMYAEYTQLQLTFLALHSWEYTGVITCTL